MSRLFTGTMLVASLIALGLFATPAPAAKGVKKTEEHHVSGKIVSVQPAGKGGQGSLVLHVTHHKHKKGTPITVVKGTNKTFTINKMTKVDGHMGKATGLAALRAGEHVTVFSHKQHADVVVIHHHKKKGAAKIAKG